MFMFGILNNQNQNLSKLTYGHTSLLDFMQPDKLLQIRDPPKCIELILQYVVKEEVVKALDLSLDYVEFLYE